MKYISLLRGINVGGTNSIKMADLVDYFKPLGFRNVKTYVQSGNIIFDYDSTATITLKNKIEEQIRQVFGLTVKTLIRTCDELKDIIDVNPFIKEQNIELDKLHVTFLSDMPEPIAVSSLSIKKEEAERFEINLREIYLYCPYGYGNTKLNNAMFEKKLNTSATTRNWKTVNKLLEMCMQNDS